MDIRNATQFSNLIQTTGLQMKDMAFQQIVFCVDQLGKMCNCWKAEDKKKLYDNCTMIYMNAVKNVIPKFKTDILAKTDDRQISFYLDNGSLIGIVCR
jgi:hypothetical protein